jgi:flagellar hook-basal body complex protein FliE
MSDAVTNGVNFYEAMQGGAKKPGLEARETQTSFAAELGKAMSTGLQNTANTLKTSEAASVASLDGKISTEDLVQSISQAQVDLDKLMAIQKKVIEAWNDISKMNV